jgi:alpha-glucosidase
MIAVRRMLNRIAGCAACLMLAVAAMNAGGQTAPVEKTITAPSSEQARQLDWWKNAVIYEIYPRSFQDTNGDGIGDLNGIARRLDYLKDLGVDAIWLTPVYPSPDVDFGYDISNYIDIDPRYGTLADFDRLVAEAKKRNIRVIMDMVMNHTSDQHEWFIQSRSSRDNPYRDWYMWRDGKDQTATDKGQPPNNWQSLFGHSAWRWDENTRQYYYHKFYYQQPDLNWRNPAVHEAFKQIMAFWLKRGVGGFRFDAITTLFEDPSLADEDVLLDKDGKPKVNAFGDPQLDNSKTDNQPGVHEVIEEMRAEADKFVTAEFPGTRVLIGETYLPNIGELEKMYGTLDKPEFHLPMDTQVGMINKMDVAEFRQKLIDAEKQLSAHTPLLFIDNHDNRRVDARYGDGVHDVDIQRVMATILLASRGSALVYYGDEIGMKTTPPERKEDVKDPIGIIGWPIEKGRDGERTPMQWDATRTAGFTTGTPWLPVPPSAKTINVRAEQIDPDSLLAWYKALIQLKKTVPAFESGANIMLDPENTKVLSWMRQATGAPQIVVCVNFSANPETVDLTIGGAGVRKRELKTLLKTPGGPETLAINRIELGPFGVYIGEVQ